MKIEKYLLWPEGRMPSKCANQTDVPYVELSVPDRLKSSICLVVSPGGCYNFWAWDVEGVPVREYFLAKGIAVAALRYRTPRPENLPKHLTAWQDAQRAVRIVRRHAPEFGLDPDKIGYMGFSAGGHLALMVATSSETRSYEPIDELDDIPCNVNFAIPVYPAYVLSDGYDAENTAGGNDLSFEIAPEFRFDSHTPPMFLFHGDVDAISTMGSIRVYHKLRTMGVSAEMHIFARKGHVFFQGAAPDEPAGLWKDRAFEWMRFMGFIR